MDSLNLNLFQLLLRNTFHGSSGQLFLGKAVYSTSWQSSSGRVYPVEACSGKADVLCPVEVRREDLRWGQSNYAVAVMSTKGGVRYR